MYQNKKVGVIIAAAGSGTRMGGGISKQFRKIKKIPVLSRAVKAFDTHELIDEIIIVTKADSLDFCRKEMIAPFGFSRVCGVVAGGDTRQDSVYRGLLALSPDMDLVLVHDGARPFVSHRVIADAVKKAAQTGAAVVAVPVKDTIKVVSFEESTESIEGSTESIEGSTESAESDRKIQPAGRQTNKGQAGHEVSRTGDWQNQGEPQGIFSSTPDRSVLYAVQTPQAFSVPLLREAMEKAFSEKFYGTDDSVLVERLGQKVYLVKGEHENIKITTAEDMEIGAAIVDYMEHRMQNDGGRNDE